MAAGDNLTPLRAKWAKDLSTGLNKLLKLVEARDGANKTTYGSTPAMRVFSKVGGAPSDNTPADSPGCDLCFVWDEDNKDLYFIYGWTADNSFTALRVIN